MVATAGGHFGSYEEYLPTLNVVQTFPSIVLWKWNSKKSSPFSASATWTSVGSLVVQPAVAPAASRA